MADSSQVEKYEAIQKKKEDKIANLTEEEKKIKKLYDDFQIPKEVL